MTTATSLGLDNLKFFTGDGKEIIMKRQFSAAWEIIPHTFVFPSFYRNPSGHFEITRPKDLSTKLTGDGSIPDGLGHIISNPIQFVPNNYYVITATPDDFEDFIILRDKYGTKQGTVNIKSTASEVSVKIICAADKSITVVETDDIIINITAPGAITNFTVRTAAGDTTASIIEYSSSVIVVVDEPGQVSPSAYFARRPHDRDYIYNHKLIHSTNGVVTTKDENAMYEEITEDERTYWTLTDIFDIIFFSYKVTVDGKDYTEGNTIRITLNDGKDIYIEEYPLVDFLRCTLETGVLKNLETYDSYQIDNATDPTESLQDLMNYNTTKTSKLYGVKAPLFAEVLMSGYDLYTEDTLKDLTKLITAIQAHPEKTDKEIVSILYSFLKEHKIKPEWWTSAEILSIIKSEDTSENIAIRFLNYIIYGPDEDVSQSVTVAKYLVDYNIPKDQYPYVKYYGTVYQDKASAGLIDAQTIVVVTDNGSDASLRYTYPTVSDDVVGTKTVEYRLHFRFEENSEMFFASMVDDSQLKRLDTLYALTPEEINTTGSVRETNALHFTVGFEAKEEGCFENSLGMFIMNTENQEEDFFIGLLQFRTEVEDEDERYRTLFTNFGVPDPIVYPNIFKEQDPQEEGTDWRLVNKKSKELFLEYDLIFPYVGTYRALFNAIKYLGYQDIIFKEWYRIKDHNDKTKYVAIQNYDTAGGKSIRNTLKSYGVNYEDYERYRKLNRLSMIYHLQEINEQKQEKKQNTKAYLFAIAGLEVGLPEENVPFRASNYSALKNKFSGEWALSNVIVYRAENRRLYLTMTKIDESGNEVPDLDRYITYASTLNRIVTSPRRTGYGINVVMPVYGDFNTPEPFVVDETGRHDYSYQYDEIPAVDNIYEYRNDEVLLKLYSVKNWLEEYITGVNCYISDINGEYITLERIKTVGYVTGGEVHDITTEGLFTPHCEIRKTLNPSTGEYVRDTFTDSSINIQCSLNEFRSATFEDYADYPIERFIKWNYNGQSDENTPLIISAQVDGVVKDMPVYVSAPINALTVADEYQYALRLENPESGSLYEFTDSDCLDNPIIVQDGEIKFMDDSQKSSYISNSDSSVSSNECPVIQITKGNLRRVSGDWAPDSENNNIEWSITTRQIIEEGYEDAQTYVIMKSMNSDVVARFKGAVNLSPDKTDAEFLYTSENKWQLLMFIVTGYCPTNQLRSDYLSEEYPRISEIFDSSAHYILDIVEGRILFRNHHVSEEQKMCKSAEINFRFTDEKEQEITLDYTYESDRTPVYTFDSSAFVDDITGVGLSTKDFYDKMNQRITENTSVNIPVNRLGDYVVSVKAYDAYNNIYTNESDDKCTVSVKEPTIDIIVNQVNASNGIWFYKDSPDGINLTTEQKQEVLSTIEETPLYPIEYKVYSAAHNINNHTISYDSITYALDTPKAEDYLTLTNMTEAAYNVTIDDNNTATILMKSGNPNKQNIYNKGGQVTLCVYDDNQREILLQSDILNISGTPVPPTTFNGSEIITSDGKIVVANVPANLRQYVDRINDGNDTVNLYVINATVIELSDDIISKMVIDTVNRTTFIPMTVEYVERDNRVFHDDTMIKVCTVYVKTDGTSTNRVTETAFRVTGYEYNSDLEMWGYVIDGIIDVKFINDLYNRDDYLKTDANDVPTVGSIRFYMKPLHIYPVEYNLRVNEDAVERSYMYGDEGDFYMMRTNVVYNPYQLLFDDYVDDTYSVSDSHFDHDVLKEMWTNPTDVFSDASLYLYKNTPITVGTDRYLIIRPCDDIPQIENDYRVKWRWLSYGLEDKTNWKDNDGNMDKLLLFESKNRVLTVSPFMFGALFIELHCMDKYGNVIKNTRGGNVMVDSEQSTEKIHTLI